MESKSFYFTEEEISNLVSYFKTTTNWLCMNNCENEFEKRETYCLIHDISKRFQSCCYPWIRSFE